MRSIRSGRVTKVAAHHRAGGAGGDSASIRVRLTASDPSGADVPGKGKPLGAEFDRVFKARRKEADEFYATVIPPTLPTQTRRW